MILTVGNDTPTGERRFNPEIDVREGFGHRVPHPSSYFRGMTLRHNAIANRQLLNCEVSQIRDCHHAGTCREVNLGALFLTGNDGFEKMVTSVHHLGYALVIREAAKSS
jgi:hypothetical protein